ncbi:MAG: pyridoxamine 5'-phosphate oxidase family protein [Acidobacteriota bacterium]|nr:pyridoxamine 5'-phosphate oxidase family protein [Acidobacteriota bacterium]
MAKFFERMEPAHRKFIEKQHVFFNASAPATGRVNVSPRATALLRVLDEETVVYLDLTGSGNETAAHLRDNGRLTLMFCAFEGAPLILRLYGEGRILPRGSEEYASLLGPHFNNEEPPGTRQMVLLKVKSVQTSCGYNVPLYDYKDERETLIRWAEAKRPEALEAYRHKNNACSIDGLPTGMFEEETAAS